MNIGETWSGGGGAALTRGLRAVRVLLSAAFVGLILAAPASDTVVVERSAMMAAAALALGNVLVNGWFTLRPPHGPEPAWAAAAQLIVDALLAIIAAVLLDPAATPLAWVALMVPVLDAAVMAGPALAGAVWLALGIAYIGLRLRVLPPGTSGDEIIRLSLQQLAAAAAVAIPTGYLAARLRDDLDRAHETLLTARRRADDLERVATHARTLTEAADPDEVLKHASAAARDLGFDRADVCQRDGGGRWRITHGIGPGRSPDPNADRALERALAENRPTLIGAGRNGVDELQWLHLSGFEGGLVVPVWQGDGRATALRVWAAEPLTPDHSAVQALELLGTQAAAAWGNALRYTSLAGWSRMVAYEASHDPLTGLANRSQLMTHLDRALRSRRAGGPPFALLYLDLNGFKQVNDTLGHDAGDAVLIAVAQRLLGAARPSDTVARLGGDEFVVMLNGVRALDDAVAVAERVCEALGRRVAVGQHRVQVGTSIGIGWGDGHLDVDALLRRADEAMFRAKRRGTMGYELSEGLTPPGATTPRPADG